MRKTILILTFVLFYACTGSPVLEEITIDGTQQAIAIPDDGMLTRANNYDPEISCFVHSWEIANGGLRCSVCGESIEEEEGDEGIDKPEGPDDPDDPDEPEGPDDPGEPEGNMLSLSGNGVLLDKYSYSNGEEFFSYNLTTEGNAHTLSIFLSCYAPVIDIIDHSNILTLIYSNENIVCSGGPTQWSYHYKLSFMTNDLGSSCCWTLQFKFEYRYHLDLVITQQASN